MRDGKKRIQYLFHCETCLHSSHFLVVQITVLNPYSLRFRQLAGQILSVRGHLLQVSARLLSRIFILAYDCCARLFMFQFELQQRIGRLPGLGLGVCLHVLDHQLQFCRLSLERLAHKHAHIRQLGGVRTKLCGRRSAAFWSRALCRVRNVYYLAFF